MIIHTQDDYYMQQALELAEIAFSKQEVPIGSVVVNAQSVIIGRGYNSTQATYSQTGHAEVRAIEDAGQTTKDWRLDKCTLYVTLEPCLMCMSLIGLSRIERIVYGAKSPLFGYHLDKESLPDLYKKQIKGVTSGVLAQESELLLKRFFKTKRNRDRE
ncbi:nucleoside deaminase [Candidatus Dependentiae bacterium]|nr:nucleoside deaminase [Candidatus Dependentiae bacterium]